MRISFLWAHVKNHVRRSENDLRSECITRILCNRFLCTRRTWNDFGLSFVNFSGSQRVQWSSSDHHSERSDRSKKWIFNLFYFFFVFKFRPDDINQNENAVRIWFSSLGRGSFSRARKLTFFELKKHRNLPLNESIKRSIKHGHYPSLSPDKEFIRIWKFYFLFASFLPLLCLASFDLAFSIFLLPEF